MSQVEQGLDRRQQLLAEIRDKLCAGNAADLARQIGKDPTYVNRLFYPEGKAGRKGIGLEIMAVCQRAFFLPAGFWDQPPPALDDDLVEFSTHLRGLRDKAARGEAHPDEIEYLKEFENYANQRVARTAEQIANWKSRYDTQLAGVLKAQERLALYTGDEPRTAFGMAPILAWEHPDDLPPGDFIMVPRLDVHLSAGGGRDQVEIELIKDNPQAFRSEWIRLMKLKPNKLAAMRADGRSMEPTVHDGDSLLVDTSQTDVSDGKVYALWYDGGERVKRLFRLPGGGLRIKSDNPEHGTIELGPDYSGHVRIIGRVVHRSGIGGL